MNVIDYYDSDKHRWMSWGPLEIYDWNAGHLEIGILNPDENSDTTELFAIIPIEVAEAIKDFLNRKENE